MNNFWRDVRYGARTFAKNPGLTAIAILTLAAGIGANTAMFSVVNAVLLRPLSYPEPDRIVTISSLWKVSGGHSASVSAPDFHDWHDQATAFDSMAYYSDQDSSTVAHQEAEYSHCATVTPEFFQVFLQQSVVGHFFTSDEQKAGAVVISDAYWKRVYGGNPNAIGQSLRLFGRSLPIVGVAPPEFSFPPKHRSPGFRRTRLFAGNKILAVHRTNRVVARLKFGVSIAEAQSQMTTITARLEKEYPSENKNKSAVVVGMRDGIVSNFRRTLYLLLGAVSRCTPDCLCKHCEPVGSQGCRTHAPREIAVRSVMGASRGHIIRQILTESGLLALVSGITGLVLALLCTKVLTRLGAR